MVEHCSNLKEIGAIAERSSNMRERGRNKRDGMRDCREEGSERCETST